MDTTLRAHGITPALGDRFDARASLAGSAAVSLRLQSGAAVRLTLRPDATAFGVTTSRLNRDMSCTLSLSSPTSRLEVELREEARHVLTSADGSPLVWVELQAQCQNVGGVEITELWLGPKRAPDWQRESTPAAPAIEASAVPEPMFVDAAGRLRWEPPLDLAHIPHQKPHTLALAVLEAPAVMAALGIRPGVDAFDNEPFHGREIVLLQNLRSGDEFLKVEDGYVKVVLEDGFRLKSVDGTSFVRDLKMPRRAPLSPAVAARLSRRKKLPRADRLALGFFERKLVYAYGDVCQRSYLDAFTGAYFEGPGLCRRGGCFPSAVPRR